jgi:glycolate oxidase iron-sulfur subunit
VLQPELSQGIRARKLAAIARAGAPVVASANPGCSLHLAAAGVQAKHPISLVAEAIRQSAGVESPHG